MEKRGGESPFAISNDYFQLWKRDRLCSLNSSVHSSTSDDFDLNEFYRNGTEVLEEEPRLSATTTPPAGKRGDGSEERDVFITSPLTPAAAAIQVDSPTGADQRTSPFLPPRRLGPQTLKLYADLLKLTGRRNWDILCPFCRNNGEDPAFYRNHALKDSEGRTTCPVLRRYTCPKCQATGDDAHTISYCPFYDGFKRNNRKLNSFGIFSESQHGGGGSAAWMITSEPPDLTTISRRHSARGGGVTAVGAPRVRPSLRSVTNRSAAAGHLHLTARFQPPAAAASPTPSTVYMLPFTYFKS